MAIAFLTQNFHKPGKYKAASACGLPGREEKTHCLAIKTKKISKLQHFVI
jgi:hypothetical protein